MNLRAVRSLQTARRQTPRCRSPEERLSRERAAQAPREVTADPNDATRRTRSGWGDAASKSRGWRVDGLTDKTAPYYAENSTTGFHGQSGGGAKPARLRDTPGDWSTAKNVGKEFRIDNDGKATMFPAKPVAHAGSSTEVNDAAARWDAIAGNTKINQTT